MMHNNTKFGNKIFGGSEDIIWTNINILTLRPESSYPFFSQDILAYGDVSSDQVWLPRNQQFRKYSRKSHFDHMSPHYDLDCKDSNNNNKNLQDTLAHDAASLYKIW